MLLCVSANATELEVVQLTLVKNHPFNCRIETLLDSEARLSLRPGLHWVVCVFNINVLYCSGV